LCRAMPRREKIEMASQLIIASTKAKANDDGDGFAVIYDLTGAAPPMPRRIVEVRTLYDCKAAHDAYVEEAKATGLPMVVTLRIADGWRAPAGFNKWRAGAAFYTRVNV